MESDSDTPPASTSEPDTTRSLATPPAASKWPVARQAQAPPLVPARMLNEFAYCPRLAYLEWVQREWADNVETLEGKHVHRRVDEPQGARAVLHDAVAAALQRPPGPHRRHRPHRAQGGRARPVDYKRGRQAARGRGGLGARAGPALRPGPAPARARLPVPRGRDLLRRPRSERVRIRFTPQLVERTLQLLTSMRAMLGRRGDPAAARGQPEVPALLAGVDLPAGGGAVPASRRATCGRSRVSDRADPSAGRAGAGARCVRLSGERLLVESAEGRVATRLARNLPARADGRRARLDCRRSTRAASAASPSST